MRRFTSAAAMVAASAVLAASACGTAAASAGVSAGHQAPAGPAAARPEPAHGMAAPVARRLLLISGDQLAVRSADGRQEIAADVGGRADAVTGLRFGGQELEIPTIAMPYLGRGLDQSLFEVSALEKIESGGRLPVRVTYAGRRPALPGVRLTRWAGGVARGYLTSASARRFGAALMRQFRSDHATGRYGDDGLFGGGVRITLAGGPRARPPAPGPAFKMNTLTVHASDPQGRPDTGGEILIANVDDGELLAGANDGDGSFYRGSTAPSSSCAAR